MTEYEKKELARAYEEMKPENFLKNISIAKSPPP